MAKGRHKNRLGYYDDETVPNNFECTCGDEEECTCDPEQVAIVYLDDVLICRGRYHLIPFGRLRPATAEETAEYYGKQRQQEDAIEPEDLTAALEATEERLKEANDRWTRLKAKVEGTLENLDRGRRAAEAELVMAANALKLAKPPEHEAATAKAMLMAEQARRAYAMYDAIRSVKIWMEGYL